MIYQNNFTVNIYPILSHTFKIFFMNSVYPKYKGNYIIFKTIKIRGKIVGADIFSKHPSIFFSVNQEYPALFLEHFFRKLVNSF